MTEEEMKAKSVTCIAVKEERYQKTMRSAVVK